MFADLLAISNLTRSQNGSHRVTPHAIIAFEGRAFASDPSYESFQQFSWHHQQSMALNHHVMPGLRASPMDAPAISKLGCCSGIKCKLYFGETIVSTLYIHLHICICIYVPIMATYSKLLDSNPVNFAAHQRAESPFQGRCGGCAIEFLTAFMGSTNTPLYTTPPPRSP